MKKKIIKMKGSKKAEILIYEDIGEGWIGGISAKAFADDVKALGKLEEINVRINSPGGSVFDGVAMYNTLLKNPARIIVDIDGLAASIASIVAMAGDEVRMAENAMMMIHDPWIVASGKADELREQANVMDKVRETLLSTYVRRSGADEKTISDMMAAETWMNATEAEEAGLIDSVTVKMKLATSLVKSNKLSRFKNVPRALLLHNDTTQPSNTSRPRIKRFQSRLAKQEMVLRKHRLSSG